jgi:two-component system chemotaxis response regulator CheY
MSGLELLQQLKQQGCPSQFGFVTAEAAASVHSRALEEGALFFITKPFTPEAFEQTLTPIIGHA